MLLYTPPKTSSIPVIDLGDSFSSDALERRRVADEIHKAARDTGFFYVRNHRVAPDLVARTFAWSKRFFELPIEDKRAIAMPKGEPRGWDHLESQILDTGSPGDLKETFMFAGERPPSLESISIETPNMLPNRWPAALPGFANDLLTYHASLRELGVHVMRLIALSLDMLEDYFDEAYRFANPTTRLNRYPPQPSDAAFNQLGAGAHTDWGGITLLAQADVEGLEVQSAGGDWLRAKPIPGTFVINLGDLMARWTNDLYHSTLHRVMNNDSGRDRYSIAFFFSPAYHTRIECLPTCLAAGEQPKYPPCTAGEYVHEKRLTTYGVK